MGISLKFMAWFGDSFSVRSYPIFPFLDLMLIRLVEPRLGDIKILSINLWRLPRQKIKWTQYPLISLNIRGYFCCFTWFWDAARLSYLPSSLIYKNIAPEHTTFSRESSSAFFRVVSGVFQLLILPRIMSQNQQGKHGAIRLQGSDVPCWTLAFRIPSFENY